MATFRGRTSARRALSSLKRKCKYIGIRLAELPPWTPSDGFPIPPPHLRDKVRRGQMSRKGFIGEGRQVFEALLSGMSRFDISPSAPTKVFEFGCGCGRIARYFLDAKMQYTGCDVDEELVTWSTRNLPAGTFFTNSYEPTPLSSSDDFDVVFAISVFTHIPVAEQRLWIDQLTMLLRPGGVLLISFLELPSNSPQEIEVRERLDPGIRRDWLGRAEAPSRYLNCFHTANYISRNWTGQLDLVDISPAAIRSLQSLAILQKVVV